jgi:hypothetical protein
MKIRRQNSETGGVLVVTLIICGLVGMMLIAYLAMVGNQHRFSQRSQVWNNCIPMCEAGVEEALAHINHMSTSNTFAVNGWTLSGGYYRKQRVINGGTNRMVVDNNMPPMITVTSILSAPVQATSLKRVVQVKTRFNQKFAYGVLSRGIVDLGGGGRVDSFDSTQPGVESDASGYYNTAYADDEATVVTASQSTGNMTIGNGTVYGSVATGAGGDVTVGPNGNVGDATYNDVTGASGTVEPDHYTDDVNVYIPPGVLPVPYPDLSKWQGTPGPGLIGPTFYPYILGNGDYRFVGNLALANVSMIVTGKARIHVTGTTSVSGGAGQIIIAPGASVEWYAQRDVSIAGAGVMNHPGYAKNFTLVGISPTCTRIDYIGSTVFCGTIYAPSADIKMSGASAAIGAWVGKTFKIIGTMDLHYDESLKSRPNEGRFIAASWKEL